MRFEQAEIIGWVAAVAVPLLLVLVVFLLTRPWRKRSGTATSDILLPVLSAACTVPIECTPGDSCGNCGWACQEMEQGHFCLPPRPLTMCAVPPSSDSSKFVPGVWRWGGWSEVNVQDWVCSCPEGYPANAEGACERANGLCRYGTWTYPCDAAAGECRVDPTLIGAAVRTHGQCMCDDVTCTGDGDCAGRCQGGKCVDQRRGTNLATGLPVCVPDTCANTVVSCGTCPPGGTCVAGSCVGGSCEEDEACGPAGKCRDGVCTWGKWGGVGCVCPSTCTATPSSCKC
jgi:hypothetical protein